MRVTIKDIAQLAGVSKTTVSFAFNEPSKISKETCARIMRIAEELGYIPDPVARILTMKHIGNIGYLLPQSIPEAMKNPYLSEILQGIGQVCQEDDLSLNIIPPIRGCIADAVRRAAVDAFITVGVAPDSSLAELFLKRRIPYVTIDGEGSDQASNVGIDDRAAARGLMRAVLASGAGKIAIIQLKSSMITLPEERFSTVLDMRMAGFEDALRDCSRSLDDGSVQLYSAESSIEGGRECAARIFSHADAPTAIVCMSDIIACGVYAECRARSLAIPGDVSVAGFDDIPMARLLEPGLTTVRQPGFEKGRIAARFALDRIAGKPVEHATLPTELVVRGSLPAAGA